MPPPLPASPLPEAVGPATPAPGEAGVTPATASGIPETPDDIRPSTPGWETAWSLRLASRAPGRRPRRTSATTGDDPSSEEDPADLAPPPEGDSPSLAVHEWPAPEPPSAHSPGPGALPRTPDDRSRPGEARHVTGPLEDLTPDPAPSPGRRSVDAPPAALSYAPPHRPLPTVPPSVPAVRRPEQGTVAPEPEVVTRAEPPAVARPEVPVPYPVLIAVGGMLPPPEESVIGRSGSARTRAAQLWFGAPPARDAWFKGPPARDARPSPASAPAPLASWSAPGGDGDGPLGSVPSGTLPPGPFTGVPPAAFPPEPSGEWAGPPRSGAGSGGGSGPAAPGVPLDRTPEWAALMDLLASHRRQRPFGHMDDPAFLDALAGRLHDRVLARIRRELVVDRERNGLLVPRT
ncbi:hypothetical protein [Streptomyces sp. NPDC007984]|uniref:hypothetical protein n=1 Tax=Streptomyces sp. NPDC007984 TaxID=3364801 RepID=UPI0036E210C5